MGIVDEEVVEIVDRGEFGVVLVGGGGSVVDDFREFDGVCGGIGGD